MCLSPVTMVLKEVWLPLPSAIFTLLAFAADRQHVNFQRCTVSCLPETTEDWNTQGPGSYCGVNFEVLNHHNINVLRLYFFLTFFNSFFHSNEYNAGTSMIATCLNNNTVTTLICYAISMYSMAFKNKCDHH